MLFIIIYITGIIFGILLTKDYNFEIPKQSFSIMNIIYVFSITYFMFFILIITRKTFIIFIELIIFIYFRGFSLGVLISALLINNFIRCLFIIITEIILLIFLFTIIFKNIYDETNDKTNKLLIALTISVLIYSFILEMVGDKFG